MVIKKLDNLKNNSMQPNNIKFKTKFCYETSLIQVVLGYTKMKDC